MHCTERRTTPIPAPLRHDWEHGERLYGGQLHSHPLLISVLCAIGSFSPERLLSQARHDSTAPILHASPFCPSEPELLCLYTSLSGQREEREDL